MKTVGLYKLKKRISENFSGLLDFGGNSVL